jgi:hypothetical protein
MTGGGVRVWKDRGGLSRPVGPLASKADNGRPWAALASPYPRSGRSPAASRRTMSLSLSPVARHGGHALTKAGFLVLQPAAVPVIGGSNPPAPTS